MKIYGFNKTTLLDYPEHVAATVFTGGCNFRCPFCQNAGLVLCPAGQPLIPEEEIFAHLKKRQGILDGICITGGEPTLSPDLEDFIRRVKKPGYAVKLDTNGYRPEVLEGLLQQGLLDYVAMDIKASKENYARAAGYAEAAVGCGDAREAKPAVCDGKRMHGFDLARIERSVELLKNGTIPYEFRTTVVKGLHRPEEFEEIGKWLAGCRAYFLQSYEESGEILAQVAERLQPEGTARASEAAEQESHAQRAADTQATGNFASFSEEELRYMAELAGKYIDRVELRGIG